MGGGGVLGVRDGELASVCGGAAGGGLRPSSAAGGAALRRRQREAERERGGRRLLDLFAISEKFRGPTVKQK